MADVSRLDSGDERDVSSHGCIAVCHAIIDITLVVESTAIPTFYGDKWKDIESREKMAHLS